MHPPPEGPADSFVVVPAEVLSSNAAVKAHETLLPKMSQFSLPFQDNLGLYVKAAHSEDFGNFGNPSSTDP
ncbi:hypothetical protein AAC387_Pa06g1520 [Persea americana]